MTTYSLEVSEAVPLLAELDRYCPGMSDHLRETDEYGGDHALVLALLSNLATTMREVDGLDRLVEVLTSEAILHGLDPAPELYACPPDPEDPR